MGTRITVNGVEYESLDQLPPHLRVQYDRVLGLFPDRDQNGVPDLLERVPPSTHIEQRIVTDPAQLDDEERRLLERLQQSAGQHTDGKPLVHRSTETHIAFTTTHWPGPTGHGGRVTRGLLVLLIALIGLLLLILGT